MRYLAWTMLLAACGSGPMETADAASGPPVTVTITYAGSPQVGVLLYFQNADSSLVTSTMTDATGAASAMIAAGGFVTAVGASRATTDFDEIDTFASVQPGDHLVLTGGDAVHTPITVHVIAPRDAGASATSYGLVTSCGSGALTAPASGSATGTVMLDGCDGKADMLVTVANIGGTTDFFYAPGVFVADTAIIDLTAHSYTAASPTTFTLSNVSAATAGVELTTTVFSPRGKLLSLQAAPPGSSTRTAQLAVPTFQGAVHLVEMAPNGAGIATKYIDDWGPYAASYSVDLGARLLTDLATTSKFDPATHSLRWTEASGGTTPSAAFGVVGTARGTRNWLWSIVAPHNGTSIRFPVLPVDGFDYNIAVGDTPGFVSLQLADVSGGYDTWRTRPVQIGPHGKTVLAAVAGSSGSASSEVSAQL